MLDETVGVAEPLDHDALRFYARFPFGSLRRSPPFGAEGYSSLAYRLIGYADPVQAGCVSHRNRYRSTCVSSTSATVGVAHLR